MTDARTLDLDLELTLREEAQDGYLATLYGLAMPYETQTQLGGRSESFAREAFDPADVIGKPLAWRHGDPIGVITAAHNTDDGLYITASIVDTVQGRDAAALLRAGAVTGLSPGFIPKGSKWLDKARTHVQHLTARLLEVSLTHQPAYATAGVSEVREEQPMSDTITDVATAEVSAEDIEAREQIADLRNKLEAIAYAGGGDPVHPLAQYRSIGEYAKAVVSGVEERALNVSALSEQTGLVPPLWLTDIKGVLERKRKCINALGGPLEASESGFAQTWPYFDGDLSAIVAAQAAENDEVNSADIDILQGTANLATYGSGNRLTYQVIKRASPSYVTAHMRILMGAYAVETDYAFQTALWANDTITTGVDYDFSADTTGAAFVAAVWKAMVQVEAATGEFAEAVFVDSTVFEKVGDPAWTGFQAANYSVNNTRGTVDGTNLGVNIYGVPVVLASNFATDETQSAIVTNRAAIGWAEDGPMFASAEQAANLGRDQVIWGMGVATPFIASGIRSIYNAV